MFPKRATPTSKGIRQNDILTAVNGTAVSTIDELNTIKNQYSAEGISFDADHLP